MGADGSLGGAEGGDTARAEAIRASVDLADPKAARTYGEQVLVGLFACLDQVAEAARGHDLEQSAGVIRRLRARIERADASMLTPKSGIAGLFDSRGARLDAFREAFADVVRELTDADRDLSGRAGGLERRWARLEGLHTELRRLISELDAWIAAGLTDLSARGGDAGEPTHPLAARLSELQGLRREALSRLALIRACQNAEGSAPVLNANACQALAAWHEDWSKALGVDGGRARRVRPDAALLHRARDALVQTLRRIEDALEQAAARRAGAADRMARISVSRDT